MHTRVLEPKHGPILLVRPLRHGDVGTVAAMFERLGEQSRRARFNGPKPRLSTAELDQLASVDSTRHALVAYVEGDRRPVAIARLVRDGDSAEIAFEVADEYQQRGIGSALTAGVDRRRTSCRDHGDHRSRVERQPRRRRAAAPDPERARHPLRGPRALDPRSPHLTGRPVLAPRRRRVSVPGRREAPRASRRAARPRPSSARTTRRPGTAARRARRRRRRSRPAFAAATRAVSRPSGR